MDADIVSHNASAASEEAEAARGATPTRGPSEAASGSSGSSSTAAGTADPVNELVAGLSSWWGGFSKKSAETFEAARANIQSGSQQLVQVAKQELTRFEQSLEEAQKRAREEAQAAPSDTAASADGEGTEEAAAQKSAKGKGKARQLDDDTDEDASGDSTGVRSAPLDDIATVDANGDIVGGRDPSRGPGSQRAATTFDLDIEQRLGQASALFSNFAKSLQSDPRIQSIQRSLAGGAGAGADGEAKEKDGAAPLKNLSATIQASLPHLSWAQSQALAEKAWSKSEEFAKDVIQEVKDLAGEMIQVIPPEHEEQAASSGAAAGKKSAAKEDVVFDAAVPAEKQAQAPPKSADAKAAPASTVESDNKTEKFDWDAPEHGKSDSAVGLQTSTGPPTGSWGDSDDETPASTPVASKAPAATSAAKGSSSGTVAKAADAKKQGDAEDDEDSDWE